MDLIFTPSTYDDYTFYITLSLTIMLSLYVYKRMKKKNVSDSAESESKYDLFKKRTAIIILILIVFIFQIDRKIKVDDVAEVIESNCSIRGCIVVTGNVERFKSYKDKRVKNFQTNEFHLGNHHFKFIGSGDGSDSRRGLSYSRIVELGGVLTPNSGTYKAFVYKGKIIKLWRSR
ncbi:hypothetical protein HWV03_12435 [Moritella sp. 36]|uniref:hypothetical protein n=1 Tax=Moritella sp. 36 TaxID=2746233 RepID=UPI001BA6E1DA|nr:hypothetical protein [Moritella sp. 36]QUM89550.1 hypothetical protein HWV03_12435 [Moritella sp. 36]